MALILSATTVGSGLLVGGSGDGVVLFLSAVAVAVEDLGLARSCPGASIRGRLDLPCGSWELRFRAGGEICVESVPI